MLLGRNRISSKHNNSSILPSFSHPRKYHDTDTLSGIFKLLCAGLVVITLFGCLLGYGVFPYGGKEYIPIKGESEKVIYTQNKFIIPTEEDITLMKTSNKGVSPKLKTPLSSYRYSAPGSSAAPKIVLVTTLDANGMSQEMMKQILQNRKEYAEIHGYAIYTRFSQEYQAKYAGSQNPTSWPKVPISRAAMYAFPQATHYWYLDGNSLIMDLNRPIESLFRNPETLRSNLMADRRAIHKFNHPKTKKSPNPEQAHFMIGQDDIGLSPTSFIFKNSDYSKTLLEFWNNPKHHSYFRFDKADASALNHLVQWHPIMFRKVGILPTRNLASSSRVPPGYEESIQYKPGDLVVAFKDCDKNPVANHCQEDFNNYWKLLQENKNQKKTS